MSARYGVMADEAEDLEALNEKANKDLDFIRIELDGEPISVSYSTHVVSEYPGATETEVFSYLIFYRYDEAEEHD